jgi:putative spermidine/putrescine transport system substrate-binding protein
MSPRFFKHPLDEFDTAEVCHDLKTALQSTRSRRELLLALGRTAAGGALLAAAGAGRSFAAEAQPVTAFIFGGAWKRAIIEAAGTPFTQKTGIPMRYQDPYNWPKLRAMHEAKAQQMDCASVQGTEVIQAGRLGMAAPLDWSVIDRSVLAPRQLTRPYAIGGYSLSMVLCTNTNTWSGDDHPKSWADFWNVEKFPGRRAMRRDAQWTIEVAASVDRDKNAPRYPIDLDRAFKNLDRIKPHVKTWWSDNSQAQALMERQEVDLMAVMDGRASETIANSRAPYKIVWNEQISTGNGQGWIVLQGGPNPSGAMKFLDIVGRPEALATFARLLYYAPLNLKAYDLLDPAFAKQLSSYPDNEKTAHLVNYDWWADNIIPTQRRFERWLQT